MATPAVDDRPILYLEDLVPGQRFATSTASLDEHDIHRFAGAFDPQPFHLDAEAAAAHPVFQGLSASGWHTAALTMRLLTTSAPRFAGGVIGLGGEVTWPRPVRPGDVLIVHGEIVEVRPSRTRPDRGVVTLRCETRNQHGQTVQALLARLMVFARGSAN
ncbi:MAG: MaoC family dehydratase [Proteobacteria bacterium]|nr:MAG: MaoC family dehydratase [Pseudomonadota bacterium]